MIFIHIHHLIDRRLPNSRTSGTAGRIQDHITSRISTTKTYSNKNCFDLHRFFWRISYSTLLNQLGYCNSDVSHEQCVKTAHLCPHVYVPQAKRELYRTKESFTFSTHIHVHQSREIGKHFLIFVRADTVVVQGWRELSPVAVVVDSSLNRAVKTRSHEITVTHEPGVEETVVRIRSAMIYNPEYLARETKTFITLRCRLGWDKGWTRHPFRQQLRT